MIFNLPQEVINRSLKEKEGKSSINAPFTCLYSALLSPPPSLSLLQVIKPEMKAYLAELRKRIVIGVVGGSDKAKQEEQMGGDGRKFNTCTSTCTQQHKLCVCTHL